MVDQLFVLLNLKRKIARTFILCRLRTVKKFTTVMRVMYSYLVNAHISVSQKSEMCEMMNMIWKI
jgi:hypothetical protein